LAYLLPFMLTAYNDQALGGFVAPSKGLQNVRARETDTAIAMTGIQGGSVLLAAMRADQCWRRPTSPTPC
jgi:hypothetical protein